MVMYNSTIAQNYLNNLFPLLISLADNGNDTVLKPQQEQKLCQKLESDLQQGLDPNLSDKGMSLLHLFAMCGLAKAIETLRRYDANTNIHDNNKGDTPLMLAIKCHQLGAAKALCNTLFLENGGQRTPLKGANVNEQNNSGEVALHLAVQDEYVSGVKLLVLSYDARTDICKNDRGSYLSVENFAKDLLKKKQNTQSHIRKQFNPFLSGDTKIIMVGASHKIGKSIRDLQTILQLFEVRHKRREKYRQMCQFQANLHVKEG